MVEGWKVVSRKICTTGNEEWILPRGVDAKAILRLQIYAKQFIFPLDELVA